MKDDIKKQVQYLIYSAISLVSPAFYKYMGAVPKLRAILYKKLLGSNSSTGMEIPIMLLPLRILLPILLIIANITVL
jgi:hypothetical protein